jgi:methylthioribose-1-phosphate isomerase
MIWRDHVLELVDQRVLPLRFETVRCTDALETATAIRAMVVRGAPAIGCAAAFGAAAEAWKSRDFEPAAFEAAMLRAHDVLAASRPTAVNLAWALARLRRTAESGLGESPSVIAARLEAEALRLFEEDIAANRAMGAAGAGLIPDGARVMTHCNTGALATAGHGTALGVIRSARDLGKRPTVIANETRPFLQGARLTAWELMQERIPVTLATDGMAGHLMKSGRVDVVIVGADRIAANGDTANKIGTYTLAVLAQRHGIPFYVAAPLSTFDRSLADGAGIPIEERAAEELTGFGGVRWAPEGVAAYNPAFDVTPAELITAIITERGVVTPPYKQAIAGLFAASARA